MKEASATFPSDWTILWRSLLAAFVVESVALILAGTSHHWMVHPSKSGTLDESKFVQAEVVTLPERPAHLFSEAAVVHAGPKEATISKVVGKGREKKADEKPLADSNETRSQGEQPLPPTHGPVGVYMPLPVIPTYLQSEDLNVSVVIEFFVTSRGVVTPRLLSSSGNEELDALALTTVRQWQFRPAENNHTAIDSKVPLRIEFEVK